MQVIENIRCRYSLSYPQNMPMATITYLIYVGFLTISGDPSCAAPVRGVLFYHA